MAEEGGLPHLHQGEQVIQQDDHALHDEHQGEQGMWHQVDEDGDMGDSDQDDNVMTLRIQAELEEEGGSQRKRLCLEWQVKNLKNPF